MQRRTISIFTAAAVVGAGVAVWTMATTEPVAVSAPTRWKDAKEWIRAATHNASEAPDDIRSWTGGWGVGAAMNALDDRADVEDPVAWWLEHVAPAALIDQGAEAMAVYGRGVAMQQGTREGYAAEEVQRLMRQAVEMLERLAAERPDAMRHWHWNTLGYARMRIRQYAGAIDALERTYEAIAELPARTKFDVTTRAARRLDGAWAELHRQGGCSEAVSSASRVQLWTTLMDWLEQRDEEPPPMEGLGPTWLAVATQLIDIEAPDAARRALRQYERQLMNHVRQGEVLPGWIDLANRWEALEGEAAARRPLRRVIDAIASRQEIPPINGRVWQGMVKALRELDAPDDALAALRVVDRRLTQGEVVRGGPRWWLWLADAYARLDVQEDAVRWYRRLIEPDDDANAERRRQALEDLHPVAWRLRDLGREDLAQDAWRRWLAIQEERAASEDGRDVAAVWYNLACGRALVGQTSAALDALERSVELGYRNVAHMEDDRDLDSLRDEPRYQDLVGRMRRWRRDGSLQLQAPERPPSISARRR